MKTFYDTLEVSPNAGQYVIRAAYRCLVQHCHPDKNPDSKNAGQRVADINHAYAVLSDLKKRRDYDLIQGIVRDSGERRSLNALLPARHIARVNGAPTARPFAFRPLS